MTFFPTDTIFMQIGNFSIPWYGVMIVIGVIFAYLYMADRMKKHGYSNDVVDELLILCMIGGLIGGRLVWVLTHLSDYLKYIPYIFAISDGGLDILGVAIGVMVMTLFYIQRRKMSYMRTLDICLLALLLFAVLARIGRAVSTPTVWYSVLMDALGFLFIHFLIRPYSIGRRRGDVALAVLMWLGLSRFISMIFNFDPMASNTLWVAILIEIVALTLYYLGHKRKPKKPVILFDLDGTLMDSHQMVIRCYSYLFKKYSDISLFTPELQKEVFGPSLKEEIEKLFPEQNAKELVEEYRKYQSAFSWSDEVSLFPNVKNTLDALWKKGYKLGIVSSRMTSSCESWMRQFELTYCFSTILGRDLYGKPKPAADGILYAGVRLKTGHDSCIYVGDNVTDILAAKKAGVYAIAYLSDLSKRDEIMAAEPNKIITDFEELLTIVEEDHEWSYDRC
ncbi:MAG: HAD-IA family hydrolase [Solobacterium sp.]|nr:HAD-IA family hydrolase [Solobacterium sp.]